MFGCRESDSKIMQNSDAVCEVLGVRVIVPLSNPKYSQICKVIFNERFHYIYFQNFNLEAKFTREKLLFSRWLINL